MAVTSTEQLVHFQCDGCKGWWTIGDAPKRDYWYCPWCGLKQISIEKQENHP